MGYTIFTNPAGGKDSREERIKMLVPPLHEMQKRLFLASETRSHGRGGIAEVIGITGCSRNTIKRGINELKKGVPYEGKVRTSNGRPQYGEEKYPDMENGIRTLIAGSTYGNPERVLVIHHRKPANDGG